MHRDASYSSFTVLVRYWLKEWVTTLPSWNAQGKQPAFSRANSHNQPATPAWESSTKSSINSAIKENQTTFCLVLLVCWFVWWWLMEWLPARFIKKWNVFISLITRLLVIGFPSSQLQSTINQTTLSLIN